MTEAKQLIAEIHERLNRLNELLADNGEHRKLQPAEPFDAEDWLQSKVDIHNHPYIVDRTGGTMYYVAELMSEFANEYFSIDKKVTEQQPHKLQPGDQAPAIEWLKQLDEPWRSEALKGAEINPAFQKEVNSLTKAVMIMVEWTYDASKWYAVYEDLKSKGQ